MNRRMKIVIGLSLVLLLAFGFVVIRTFVAKPQETVKIKPIPAGEYDPAGLGQELPAAIRQLPEEPPDEPFADRLRRQ